MKQIFFSLKGGKDNPKYMVPNDYHKKNKKTKLTTINFRLYYCPKITSKITTDWMCVKTNALRIFHESEKRDWFNYILWQDWKYKSIYAKNVVSNYTLRKHYLGRTLIQKV